MRKLLANLRSDESGISAVEFALVLALILAPLLLGATELGRRIWVKAEFDNAAQAGVHYAMIKGCINASTCSFTGTGIQSAVQSATSLSTAVTVLPPSGCGGSAYYCYGCPASSGVTLSTSLQTCASGGTSGTYMGLTAQYIYTPLFSSCGNLLPTSICPLSKTATITWSETLLSRVY